MSKLNSPFTTGYAFGKSMVFKLGKHEGSEGHPVNFERTGEFHQMRKQFDEGEPRDLFTEGYRTAWKSAVKPR